MNKYSKEFYNELYNEFNNSNLNVNDFCKKKGIAPSTFYKNRNINNDNEFVDITNKIKILHFEYDGFWLYYKRLETGRVKWPKNDQITDIETRQLRWLLDGLKVDQKALKKCEANQII